MGWGSGRLDLIWYDWFLPNKVKVLVPQSCPTLCNLGPSVHRILQARILEWVAMPFSRGSSWPRDLSQVSRIASRFFFFFTIWATWETPLTKWRPCESSDVKRMSCNDHDDVATSQGIVRWPSSPQDLGEIYKTDAPIQPSERTYPENTLIWGMTLTCWISDPQKCEAVHICSDAQLVVLCYGSLRKRIQDSNTSSSEPAGMSPAVDQDCPPGGPEGKGQLSAVGSL